MEDKRVFLDTNILIYAKLENSIFHEAVVNKLNEFLVNGFEFWISRQVIREYIASITREESLRDILSADLIQKDIFEFQENFKIADEDNAVTEMLLDLYNQQMIIGKQTHDANIVATMRVYKIENLFTNNPDDFKRYVNFIKIIPLGNS
jgi:predicted nucleic acid-binding protein